MQNVDVSIVGAGSAGLTLALLLAPLGLKIAVLEQGNAPVENHSADYRRVSALNLASIRLLSHVNAWSDIVKASAPYQHMEVWEADSFARIEFDAATEQLPALGWICDNEKIRSALFQQIKQYGNVSCHFNATINDVLQTERDVLVNFNNQQLLLSHLLVGADGANSFIRQQQQLPLTHWDYQQQGLVATIHCQQPHNSTARQVFLPEGPLALLPLADAHLCSIVWTVTPDQAKTLLADDDTAFNQALTAASQSVLGMLQVQGERQAFPLKMRYASSWVRDKVVLVADAAHTVHPLAGQGMNLGLMDVAALAELIAEQVAAEKPINEPRMLRRYERWRKAEAQSLIAVMEGFKRGFSNRHPLLKLVRAVGMSGVNQLPWLKRQIIAAALGNTGDLPELARPHATTTIKNAG